MAVRVLVTGSTGFLLRNVIPKYDWELVQYEHGNDYDNISLVLHFGSPSDSFDFQFKSIMAVSMIDITIGMAKQAQRNNCKMVFASSMAAVYLEDEYGIYKRAMEQYIHALVDNHVIMRIPRVYGSDRKKGLMKKIANGHIRRDEWDRQIEYIDITDFSKWFDDILIESGIQYYNGQLRSNTIKEIKELFCEF